ncbi:MAG: hypothetical protein FJW39_09910 [Acidobacteria bacterium]|nr:hypothetical protein [Acidobacteriota bacterium]
MGFALWVGPETAWCAGTHEYRPMGVAVIANTGLFAARDFDPARRAPSRRLKEFEGLFASLNDVNRHMAGRRRRPAKRGSGRLQAVVR